MKMQLSDIEARVLGCLIEKEITTPEYYPLSLNSLTAACNQKSNRDPMMRLDEKTVVKAVDRLRYELHLVWQTTAPGSRVAKYKHDILSLWKFTPPELAVLCTLLLRGPQTLGELRGRAERFHKFQSLEEVQAALDELMKWEDGPFAAKLSREPGRKEPRYIHLMCGDVPQADTPAEPLPEPARLEVQADAERFAAIEKDVAALKAEVEALKSRLAEFRKQFE